MASSTTALGRPGEAVPADPDAVPGSLLHRIRADPARAPEHIALAAARHFAPAARRWAAAHVGEPPDQLARRALARHVGMARLEGAAAGAGGALTAPLDLVALAWIQSRMTFFIAAAYGFDPDHPMRPAELLALQGFFETPAQARAALDGLAEPLAFSYVRSRIARERTLMRRLVGYLGARLGRSALGRFVPLAAVPVAATQNARATAALGHHALRYYGGGDAAAPRRVAG